MLLITGITGFSGSYFLEELIKNQYPGKIRCIVRKSSDTSLLDNCNLDIEKVVGDLGDQRFLDTVTEGVETILHMGIFDSINITKAALKNNVKKLILIHTSGVYSKYKKMAAEYKNIEWHVNQMILNNKNPINLIYVRPTMIFGHINDGTIAVFIKLIDKFRVFPIVARGKSQLQPVHGKDLGKAYYQIVTSSHIANGDYILSGEKPVSINFILTTISQTLGKKTLFINVPLKVSVLLAKIINILTIGKINYIEEVQRMGEDRSACHEKARTDFSYCPSSFKENLKDAVAIYMNKNK